AAQVTDTQTKFSMLCVAEKGTGFNWRNNDWVQTDYKPYTYVLTKVEPQEWDCASQKVSQQISPVSEARGESHGCYQLKEVGDKEALSDLCEERWNKTNSGYALLDVICEGLANYRAEVDGHFSLTRTYGIFFSGEKRDSMLLQIGKCSLLTGTPDIKA